MCYKCEILGYLIDNRYSVLGIKNGKYNTISALAHRISAGLISTHTLRLTLLSLTSFSDPSPHAGGSGVIVDSSYFIFHPSHLFELTSWLFHPPTLLDIFTVPLTGRIPGISLHMFFTTPVLIHSCTINGCAFQPANSHSHCDILDNRFYFRYLGSKARAVDFGLD